MLYSDIVPLIYVNETIYTVICPSSRFKLIILWPKINHLVQDYPKIHPMGEGPGTILSFETFLSFINRLLVTINTQLKTSGGEEHSFCPLLMPMSEAFSISFIL